MYMNLCVPLSEWWVWKVGEIGSFEKITRIKSKDTLGQLWETVKGEATLQMWLATSQLFFSCYFPNVLCILCNRDRNLSMTKSVIYHSSQELEIKSTTLTHTGTKTHKNLFLVVCWFAKFILWISRFWWNFGVRNTPFGHQKLICYKLNFLNT